MGDLERRFDFAMREIYRHAKQELNYNATRFLQMLDEHGGMETARILLHAKAVSDGYTTLWERGRLDLTVEALVLSPEFVPLFTEQETGIARRRLKEYGDNPQQGPV